MKSDNQKKLDIAQTALDTANEELKIARKRFYGMVGACCFAGIVIYLSTLRFIGPWVVTERPSWAIGFRVMWVILLLICALCSVFSLQKYIDACHKHCDDTSEFYRIIAEIEKDKDKG